MFTGIVQCVGHVLASESRGGDRRMQFASSLLGMDDVRVGDSIAVSGVCLTALDVGADHFAADVSLETLPCIIHERARMIAEDFAPSARRAEPQWWFHWGDKQRSDWGKRPARAAPAGKRRQTLC
jgi:hypothetical protein